MLNSLLFQKVQSAEKQILCVTKYWDSETTHTILKEVENSYPDIFFGLGENRVESLQEKNLPRESVHFIGNIQSQKIGDIVKYCSCVHSLASLKHAQKIENQWISVKAFIQIRLDEEKNIWISEAEISKFLEIYKGFKHLKIIGISWMGSWEFSEAEKRKEFQKLVSLRNTYIPHWLISAGTSRDYELALEEWIDVVRVGAHLLW